MPRWVRAYDTRTGRKLHHVVPEHFVTDLAAITGLSATPREKKRATDQAAQTTTEKDQP